jgi:hypothetical protein
MPTIFRSKRSELVEQELYAMPTVYNLIRSLIKVATDQVGGDMLIISFSGALGVIIECAPQMIIVKGERRKQASQTKTKCKGSESKNVKFQPKKTE